MGADQNRPPVRRARPVGRVDLPPGPARDLRDSIYRLYLEADRPTLQDLAAQIAPDPDLPGMPKKDLIGKIISGEGAASQEDTVSVAVALARAAGHADADALATKVRHLWIDAQMAPPVPPAARLGRPITQCNAIDLEVHRAITLPGQDAALPALPPYVPRAHDRQLGEVVAAAAGGASQIAVLVGGSSTGKTRACWEAIQGLAEPWSLWHPIDPSRRDAAAQDLVEVGPYTVVWLNEAQDYLITQNLTVGEHVAAGLRTLLREPGRGPVLVLATMWPHYWTTLTAPPRSGEPDPYTQARKLLAGHDITVPDAFTSADLQKLRERAAADGDRRLRHAVEHAQDGRISQHLAGVPELLSRYRNAPPAAQSIIDVAIDARRLGYASPIPYALLEQAAPTYMNDHDWDEAGEDWLEQALAYTARPCHGVPGPLVRIRPRPGQDTSNDGQPRYRLADYLEQTGRTERATVFPPISFWDAVTTGCRDPQAIHSLAMAALKRGRWHRAHQLFRAAADHGSTDALRILAVRREVVGDRAGAEALALQAAERGDTTALLELANRREGVGDTANAERLAREAADRGDITALLSLTLLREQVGDPVGAEALANQAADRGHTGPLRFLALWRKRAGKSRSAERLLRRAADRGDTAALLDLADLRDEADDRTDAGRSAREAADRGDTTALLDLANLSAFSGDLTSAEHLYRQAADRGDENALLELAWQRQTAGDPVGAQRVLLEAADRSDHDPLWKQAREREDAGDTAGAEVLAIQAADYGNSFALRRLAMRRKEAGALADVERLLQEAADRGCGASLRDLALRRQADGDLTGAERLLLAAVNCGDEEALGNLLWLRQKAGDVAGAQRLRRFGLANEGTISEPWD